MDGVEGRAIRELQTSMERMVARRIPVRREIGFFGHPGVEARLADSEAQASQPPSRPASILRNFLCSFFQSAPKCARR